MRIVMLGWEFPPFIAGGLGTACYGLTRALDRAGHEVLFVLPRPVDRSLASHVRMFSPETPPASAGAGGGAGGAGVGAGADGAGEGWSLADLGGTGLGVEGQPRTTLIAGFAHTAFVGVPVSLTSPYKPFVRIPRKRRAAGVAGGVGGVGSGGAGEEDDFETDPAALWSTSGHGPMFGATGAGKAYQGDLFAEAERYARLVVALLRDERFDVVHAHDWLTFPAGQALARVSGRPLVVHVHSTEFDRSGEAVNQRVYDVERRGMMSAARVVCVSELTRSICTRRYGVSPERIDVVYNGIDSESAQPRAGAGIAKKDKIVLFLGRITMQKGPDYFIAAARRVLEKVPEAKFIVAGSGDMELRMIELAAELGIGHRVLFTGFLRGKDVERIFRMADCYVMPSVSEPFGIAPLEAIRADVPTIISKQSGVSEVLSHTLKVDFWDIDEMANKIVAVLRHPPLGQTLREHGGFEVRRLTWDVSAEACVGAYQAAVAGASGGLTP